MKKHKKMTSKDTNKYFIYTYIFYELYTYKHLFSVLSGIFKFNVKKWKNFYNYTKVNTVNASLCEVTQHIYIQNFKTKKDNILNRKTLKLTRNCEESVNIFYQVYYTIIHYIMFCALL
jgi:C4-dicarboxylate transporter